MQYTCIKFPTVRCRLQAPTAQLPDQTDTNRAPLSCEITIPHIKSYVVSNWSNYFLSKVLSKLLLTAKNWSEPSRHCSTHSIDSRSPLIMLVEVLLPLLLRSIPITPSLVVSTVYAHVSPTFRANNDSIPRITSDSHTESY